VEYQAGTQDKYILKSIQTNNILQKNITKTTTSQRQWPGKGKQGN
jgi:hypothetical protein